MSGDQAKPSEGIPCPKCGCRHHYTRRTQRVGKRVRRYRQCRHCGRSFTTLETLPKAESR